MRIKSSKSNECITSFPNLLLDQVPSAPQQVEMTGSSGATIYASDAAQPRLVTVSPGAPHVHLSNLRLRGTLSVQEARLTIVDCRIEAILEGEQGATSTSAERGLSVRGGHVVLLRSVLHGHSAGAIYVAAAHLLLIACAIRSSRAQTGGAMLVVNGAEVIVALSHFAENRALESGGALQVPTSESTPSLCVVTPCPTSRSCRPLHDDSLLAHQIVPPPPPFAHPDHRSTAEPCASKTRLSSSATLRKAMWAAPSTLTQLPL